VVSCDWWCHRRCFPKDVGNSRSRLHDIWRPFNGRVTSKYFQSVFSFSFTKAYCSLHRVIGRESIESDNSLQLDCGAVTLWSRITKRFSQNLRETVMKRSSSLAALPQDPKPDNKWNYQDDILASNMMLVAIDEETNSSFTQRHHQGSMGSMASSRCSSRGSLNGWGSTSSRKSYKVDLSSLSSHDDTHHHQQQQEDSPKLPCSSSSKNSTPRHFMTSLSHTMSMTEAHSCLAVASEGGDSWGFFVDAAD
jgi:hypothetical protein